MTVKMALRVLEIVELFAQEQQPLPLSEVARLLEMPVSSCLGLLRTLEERGYLYAMGRRQGYYPTGRLLAMARVIDAHDPVLERIKPAMDELRNTARETVVLGKLRDDGQVVYLAVLDAPQSIRYTTSAGETRNAWSNSLGRALLGTLEPARRRKLLRGAKRTALTGTTKTGVAALEAEIERSPARGWYGNFGESVPDLAGIAWPLSIGGQVYALSVVGPRYRIEPITEKLAALLRAACHSMEGERAAAAPAST